MNLESNELEELKRIKIKYFAKRASLEIGAAIGYEIATLMCLVIDTGNPITNAVVVGLPLGVSVVYAKRSIENYIIHLAIGKGKLDDLIIELYNGKKNV